MNCTHASGPSLCTKKQHTWVCARRGTSSRRGSAFSCPSVILQVRCQLQDLEIVFAPISKAEVFESVHRVIDAVNSSFNGEWTFPLDGASQQDKVILSCPACCKRSQLRMLCSLLSRSLPWWREHGSDALALLMHVFDSIQRVSS